MISKSDNAFLFSTYSPDTTVKTKVENRFSTFFLPRAEHRECRVFVEQEKGVVRCKELPPVSYQMRRRIKVGGLKNAAVRFFSETYCAETVNIVLNEVHPYFTSERFQGRYVEENGQVYFETENV